MSSKRDKELEETRELREQLAADVRLYTKTVLGRSGLMHEQAAAVVADEIKYELDKLLEHYGTGWYLSHPS